MAIQGTVTIKGFVLTNAYFKIRLSGVNESVDDEVTSHIQNYTYDVKASSVEPPICVEGENFVLNCEEGHYSQAYNDLATKLGISNTEV